jgi:hypothetical protein
MLPAVTLWRDAGRIEISTNKSAAGSGFICAAYHLGATACFKRMINVPARHWAQAVYNELINRLK